MPDKLRSQISRFYTQHEWAFAVAFVLAMGVLAYLPFANRMGFYRDDWYVLWAGRALGPNSIIDLFTFDRPLVGYIYSAIYRLAGENALLWQLYSFGVRIVGALSFLWLIRRLWPNKPLETTTAAALMFVYPGFLQWANAMTKSNHLTTYTLALVSIAFTVAAMRSRRNLWQIIWTVASLVSGVIYWFLYEYMIGLEGLRLLVVGLLIWRREIPAVRQRLQQVLKSWAPYLVLIAAHILWRLFFFESGRPGMSVESALAPYQGRLLATAAKRLLELAVDVYETLISAWVIPINSITFKLGPRSLALAFAASLAAISLFASYHFALKSVSNTTAGSKRPDRSAMEMALLGGVAIIFALFPVVAVGRDVRWESGFDKYTLQATAGVALFIVGALSALTRPRHVWVIYAVLIGVSIATHTGNAIQWATFWEDQSDLWWQVSWRAPGIKDETVLLVEMPGKDYFEAYEVWGPANRIYNPGVETIQISAEVFSSQTLEKIRTGQTEVRGVRSVFDLERNFHKSLILSRPDRASCWHALDGDDPVFPKNTSPLLYAAVRRSKIDQIDPVALPIAPPGHIFGSEPEHDWCYYFQKASLAAQLGDWQGAADLADQALSADLKPLDRSEWMPFLRGYVMVGRQDDARQVALWIRDQGDVGHRQCDYLSESSLPDPERQAFLHELLCE